MQWQILFLDDVKLKVTRLVQVSVFALSALLGEPNFLEYEMDNWVVCVWNDAVKKAETTC